MANTKSITWISRMVNPSEERLAAYKASDVRVRIINNVAYIALLDEDIAKSVDIAEESNGR